MSSIYYKFQRLKLTTDLQAGKNDVDIYQINSLEEITKIGTKTVFVNGKPCETPDQYIYIKYLSNDGKYKFIKFDSIYTSQQNSNLVGSVSKLITDLKTAQSNKYNIGYTTERRITVKAQVTNDEYNEYLNVFCSPRIYLQYKEDLNLNDSLENWLLVTAEDNGNLFNSKKNSQLFTLTLILPEQQNILM